MNVNYINSEQRDDCVRVTFVGRDANDKVRRPVVDLDSYDLLTLVEIAKAFRLRQRQLAARYAARADTITQSGLPE